MSHLLAKVIDRFAGVLSVIWAVGGYALLRYGFAPLLQHVGGAQFAGPILLLGWFGVGLLLVIGGLRRGGRIGRVGALCAIGVFIVCAEPLHGMGCRIANTFRKDEYAFPYPGAPECRLHVPLQNQEQIAAFNNLLQEFAVSHAIPKCNNKRYTAYSGPDRCTFKGEHVAIWGGAGACIKSIGTNVTMEGGVRMLPYDEKYPVEAFKRLTDGLVADLRTAFGDKVEVNFKDTEGQ
jgi:hypothetical protein